VENEEVIDAVCAAHPELKPLPMSTVIGDRAAGLGGDAFTVAPHTHGTDGFYARLMSRA
jgi:16S rRNA (cytosine967-C5)-methyltransferase